MKTICFTGPRPKKLFGFDNLDDYKPLYQTLSKQILQFYNQGYLRFISGGAQGVDQLAFWVVNALKQKHPEACILNIVYQPFANQSDRWPPLGLFSKFDYQRMLSIVDQVVDISKKKNIDISSTFGINKALIERNKSMVDDSDTVLGVYKHNQDFMEDKHSGAANCLQYAKKMNRGIYLIDPDTLDIKQIN